MLRTCLESCLSKPAHLQSVWAHLGSEWTACRSKSPSWIPKRRKVRERSTAPSTCRQCPWIYFPYLFSLSSATLFWRSGFRFSSSLSAGNHHTQGLPLQSDSGSAAFHPAFLARPCAGDLSDLWWASASQQAQLLQVNIDIWLRTHSPPTETATVRHDV